MPSLESYHDRGGSHDHDRESSSVSTVKSRIIPSEWKGDIDGILEKQLLNANRYFADTNPRLSEMVACQALKTPEEFYSDLVKRWEWHHDFYEDLLEPAMPDLMVSHPFDLSPARVNLLKRIYLVSSRVDQATLIASAAIKKHMDYWSDGANHPLIATLSQEDQLMAISIPQESFWAQDRMDHLKYLAMVQTDPEQAEVYKQKLIHEYHAGDPEIFESRMAAWSEGAGDVADIEKKIEALQVREDFKVKHLYLTMERPRLRAMRDILIYDNVQEKKIAHSLMGISGFVLRKEILGYLSKTKILPEPETIYEYGDEQVIGGLDKLERYRREFMTKQIESYRQTGDTCGACSLMMAMHYLLGYPQNISTEHELAEASGSEILSGNHFSGLAKIAAQAGLEVSVVHSEPDRFRYDSHSMSPSMFEGLMKEYDTYMKEAVGYGAHEKTGVDINSRMVKELLEQDHLVVLAGSLGSILHAVLASGYNSEGMVIHDPLVGKQEVWSHERVDRFITTPIGKWMILLRKNQSKVEDLETRLEEFGGQANEILDGYNNSKRRSDEEKV